MTEFTIRNIQFEYQEQTQRLLISLSDHFRTLPYLSLTHSQILFLSFLIVCIKNGYGQPQVIVTPSNVPTFEAIKSEYPDIYSQLMASMRCGNEDQFRSMIEQLLGLEK